jgi:SAM-dependent methyltransferase
VSESDRERWEARYEGDASAGIPDPDPLLAEALRHAPPAGRAIDLACGRGRHAIALAEAGYEVEAVDISPRALSAARESAQGLEILWQAADLDDFGLPESTYAVICCVDFSDRALSARMVEALAPDGVLVFATCPREHSRFSPPPGEILEWFARLEVLVHREDERRIEFIGRRR